MRFPRRPATSRSCWPPAIPAPRAFVLNLASAAGGLLGASVMLLFGAQAPSALPYVIAFAAGNFLYVAMADLIPTLHHSGLDKNATRQLILIGLGIATMALL